MLERATALLNETTLRWGSFSSADGPGRFLGSRAVRPHGVAMYTKRRSCCYFVLASILFVGVFLLPIAYWRVIGWSRGEAFYQGRPTSYWASEVAQFQMVDSFLSGDLYFFPPETTPTQECLEKYLGVRFRRTTVTLLLHDQEAVPILTELLAWQDLRIRLIAIQTLGHLGPDASHALKELREVRRTTDDYLVFREAGIALWYIDRAVATEADQDRRDQAELLMRYRASHGFRSQQ